MSPRLAAAAFAAPFLAGLLTLAWIALASASTSPLALVVVAVIAAFFMAGAWELRRHRADTQALQAAIATASRAQPAASEAADPWLGGLPAALRTPVRLRLQHGASALPAPALAGFLAGLLVLLGMLGTFVGMVATLRGTGLALGAASDIGAMRGALAAPVQGLGLAFGTSVAGIAASAALGLMAALARRERQAVSVLLDEALAGPLRPFTAAWQREQQARRQAEDAAAEQAERQARRAEDAAARQALLAALAHQAELTATAAREAREAQAFAREAQASARAEAAVLQEGQDRFHAQAQAAQAALALALQQTLQQGLAEGARLAGATVQPLVAETMAALARQSEALQQGLQTAVTAQVQGLVARVDGSAAGLLQAWERALARQQTAGEDTAARLRATLDGFGPRIEAHAAALVERVAQTLAREAQSMQQQLVQAQHGLLQQADAREAGRLAAFGAALDRSAEMQRAQWQAAAETARAQQQQVLQTLAHTAQALAAGAEAQVQSTVAEVRRLVDAAAQAPQAAAEVMAGLRQALSDSLARDTAVLAEREQLLQTVGTLLSGLQHAAGEQRSAIDALVGAARALLQDSAERLTQQAEQGTARLEAAAVDLTAGGVELASLGEAFAQGVQGFGQSSQQLVAQLQGVQGALERAAARSDEQMAYVVAQARELLDLSVMAQQRVLDELQQRAGRGGVAPSQPALAGD